MTTSFVAVGHVTNDLLATGLAPGGSALYAGLTAARLGLDARIVTSLGPDFCGGALLDGIAVENVGTRTTTFINDYVGGARRARVLAVAEPIERAVEGDIVFACPVLHEIGEVGRRSVSGKLVGAGLQGWLRRLGPGGVVERHMPDLSWLRCDVAFCSVEDLGGAPAPAVAPIVVVTDGARGATVFSGGTRRHVPAFPAHELDPTGAGDVFAAAFLVALARGEPLERAGAFAACAASVVIEGVGPAALDRLSGETARRYNP